MYLDGVNYDYVINNTKKKMGIKELLSFASQSANYSILACRRISDRGVSEQIYIFGSGFGYGDITHKYRYITDTGAGYGGKGWCILDGVLRGSYSNIIDCTDRTLFAGSKPVWVFK